MWFIQWSICSLFILQHILLLVLATTTTTQNRHSTTKTTSSLNVLPNNNVDNDLRAREAPPSVVTRTTTTAPNLLRSNSHDHSRLYTGHNNENGMQRRRASSLHDSIDRTNNNVHKSHQSVASLSNEMTFRQLLSERHLSLFNEEEGEEAEDLDDHQLREYEQDDEEEEEAPGGGVQPRIVGGESVPGGHHLFPYMVALTDRHLNLICGGSLIAPQIVLTAAHCGEGVLEYAILGSVDLSTPFEAISSKDSDAEIIRLRNDEYPHPFYDPTNLRHDILVLVLEKPSTRQVLPINSNYTTPTFQSSTTAKMTTNTTKSNQGDGQLVALGFGLGTRFLELQQVSLDYVPNSMCMNMFGAVNQISGFPGITGDMLCTYTPGRDTCGGDSGGPLILLRPLTVDANGNGDGSGTGSTGWEEIQVGVTSWGVDNCTDANLYPGISSRISSSYEWIRNIVCSATPETAPLDFDCGNLDSAALETTSPFPSTNVQGPAAVASTGAVPVFIKIVFDEFALEISWEIRDLSDNTVVAEVPMDTYQYEDEVVETVYLIPGRSYQLILKDSFGDGLGAANGCTFSEYSIVAGDDGNGGTLLARGTGAFTSQTTKVFTVPVPQTMSPTTMPTLTPSAAPHSKSEPESTESSNLISSGVSLSIPVAYNVIGAVCSIWAMGFA